MEHMPAEPERTIEAAAPSEQMTENSSRPRLEWTEEESMIKDTSTDAQTKPTESHVEHRPVTERRTAHRRESDRVPPRTPKDMWDKTAAVAPIISGTLIFLMGGYFTYTFNQQQLKLQEIQTIERFIPHLMGTEQSKKAAILAISSLTNTELAGKFASIFASSGTVSALQKIATTGSDREKTVANRALNDTIDALAMRESLMTGSEAQFKKAVEDGVNNSDPTELSYSLSRLGTLYTLRGQYTLAEATLKRALEVRQQMYGPDNPLVGESLKDLADLYKATGKTDLADAYSKRAHAIEFKSAPDAGSPAPSGSSSAAPGGTPVLDPIVKEVHPAIKEVHPAAKETRPGVKESHPPARESHQPEAQPEHAPQTGSPSAGESSNKTSALPLSNSDSASQ